jgi:hypothetical protein
MKVNELRIGSIVSHDDYSEETFEVISIYLEDDNYIINTKGGKNGTWINPIDVIKKVPITKELLLKFGFWYNEETNIYQWGSYLQLGFNVESSEFCYYSLDFSRKWVTKKVKYFHELQNLCFEFEEEKELKIQTELEENNNLPF